MSLCGDAWILEKTSEVNKEIETDEQKIHERHLICLGNYFLFDIERLLTHNMHNLAQKIC